MRGNQNVLKVELPLAVTVPVDPKIETSLRKQASYAAQRLGLGSARNAQMLVWRAIVDIAVERGIVIPDEDLTVEVKPK